MRINELLEDRVDEKLKRVNGRWALVSKSDPKKVLQYYRGPKDQRPSKEWVNKVERRVHAFEDLTMEDLVIRGEDLLAPPSEVPGFGNEGGAFSLIDDIAFFSNGKGFYRVVHHEDKQIDAAVQIYLHNDETPVIVSMFPTPTDVNSEDFKALLRAAENKFGELKISKSLDRAVQHWLVSVLR